MQCGVSKGYTETSETYIFEWMNKEERIIVAHSVEWMLVDFPDTVTLAGLQHSSWDLRDAVV